MRRAQLSGSVTSVTSVTSSRAAMGQRQPRTELKMYIREYPNNPFIDFSGHVYSHLLAFGVRVVQRNFLSLQAVQLQEQLRHPEDMIRIAPVFWSDFNAKSFAPAFEEEFGIDLEGIDETLVRLMIYFALTSLLPGQDLTESHISIQVAVLRTSIAVGIYLLQTGERRTTGIDFITDAATQLGLL